MKKLLTRYIVLLVIVTFAAPAAKACDICGCGVGSSYIGILPDFGKRVFGVRYRYNSLITHIGAGGMESYLTTHERYRIADVWGGWNIGSKFRIMGYLPISFIEKTNQGITTHKNGLGDMAVQGYYQVLNKNKNIGEKMLVQSLWIGGGIKLPTGKYEPADKNNVLESANIFQSGTGSVDFSLNAMYDIRLQDAGINTTVNYKINTANRYDYQYGNKLSASIQGYYKWRIKQNVTIAPNAGIMYENAAKDMDGKYKADISGGYIVTATFGIETSFKRISVGANWQPPIKQQLAKGLVKANDRMMVHLSYSL